MRTVQELFSVRRRTAVLTGGSRLLPAARRRDELDAAAVVPSVDAGDLTGAVALFASDAGKHITVQVPAVDGGVSAV